MSNREVHQGGARTPTGGELFVTLMVVLVATIVAIQGLVRENFWLGLSGFILIGLSMGFLTTLARAMIKAARRRREP